MIVSAGPCEAIPRSISRIWEQDVAPYVRALERVAATCGQAANRLGVDLPPVAVRVERCSPGEERLSSDYHSVVDVLLSSVDQFRPPPDGANVIYGMCHEVGHIVIGASSRGRSLPPVVWDEALAHVLAVDSFMPEVWVAHGEGLWPSPYPDYPSRELEAVAARPWMA